MRKLSLLILLLVLLGGMIQLFLLRFETGDVYPRYSSLRTDPIGTKALYESLASLRTLTVSRNFEPFDKLRNHSHATVFILGEDASTLGSSDPEVVSDLEALVAEGGRLVVSFSPVDKEPQKRRSPRHKREKETVKSKEKPDEDDEESDPEKPTKKEPEKKKPGRSLHDSKKPAGISLQERWKFDIGYSPLPVNNEDKAEPVEAIKTVDADLPEEISWHTALYFKQVGEPWRIIYERDNEPVLIERKLGRGTLVLSADTYCLSNQAMLEERYPAVLAWLVGPNRELIFDECHLGLMEQTGVMGLARKYRLHGLLAGLLVLAGLFVWINALPFVPPHPSLLADLQSDQATGKDAAAGLVNLLRRTIPVRDLPRACFEEWKKSFAHRKDLIPKRDRIQAVLDAEAGQNALQRQPLQTYQTISRILAERK